MRAAKCSREDDKPEDTAGQRRGTKRLHPGSESDSSSPSTRNGTTLVLRRLSPPAWATRQPEKHDEINRKVERMIAATNALKPPTAGAGGSVIGQYRGARR